MGAGGATLAGRPLEDELLLAALQAFGSLAAPSLGLGLAGFH
jgi:hypothetical protein